MSHLHQVNCVPRFHPNQLRILVPVLLCQLQKHLRRDLRLVPKLVLVQEVDHGQQANLRLRCREPILVLGIQARLMLH